MLNSIKGVRAGLLGAVLSQALVGAALAAPAAPAAAPPNVTFGQKDASLAPAGTYGLDAKHAAVVARVSHVGYSFSIFRFDDVKGTLAWDPAQPAKSSLSVTVTTASINTNVEGFAAELAGDKYLNSKAYPEATFVSKAFRQTGPGKGEVEGDFTLMGKTKPLTFDVELVGAGKGFGSPRLGVHAVTAINPADYGLNPMFGNRIDLVVDVEFVKAP